MEILLLNTKLNLEMSAPNSTHSPTVVKTTTQRSESEVQCLSS